MRGLIVLNHASVVFRTDGIVGVKYVIKIVMLVKFIIPRGIVMRNVCNNGLHAKFRTAMQYPRNYELRRAKAFCTSNMLVFV